MAGPCLERFNMTAHDDIRDSVIRSLSAVGAINETRFYAEYFSEQDPERFALFVIDQRCLKNPLLETLTANIRILADLNLYPTLLIGALDEDVTRVKFNTQRIEKELVQAKVKTVRLNTATYGLIPDVAKATRAHRVPILERTQIGGPDLKSLVAMLCPSKVIFIQPSGGLTHNGERVPVVNLDNPKRPSMDKLSPGQARFMELAEALCRELTWQAGYVIASPLNLLIELFTTKGSGTWIRRGAVIKSYDHINDVDQPRLWESIKQGFGKPLDPTYSKAPIQKILLDEAYRGGAIITERAGLAYLSKFWVMREARGEGLARDIWDVLRDSVPAFYWRSRRDNPFNDWYLRHCDGMQVSSPWRVFWRGLHMNEIAKAIEAASTAPVDFLED